MLDEADRLLAEAFLPDIERVLVHLPTNRQSLLFSATLTKELKVCAFSHSLHLICGPLPCIRTELDGHSQQAKMSDFASITTGPHCVANVLL